MFLRRHPLILLFRIITSSCYASATRWNFIHSLSLIRVFVWLFCNLKTIRYHAFILFFLCLPLLMYRTHVLACYLIGTTHGLRPTGFSTADYTIIGGDGTFSGEIWSSKTPNDCSMVDIWMMIGGWSSSNTTWWACTEVHEAARIIIVERSQQVIPNVWSRTTTAYKTWRLRQQSCSPCNCAN